MIITIKNFEFLAVLDKFFDELIMRGEYNNISNFPSSIYAEKTQKFVKLESLWVSYWAMVPYYTM